MGHRIDGVRRRAGRGGDADVVEGNDASIRGECVHEGWIPVVEVPAEMLQQNERDITIADVAVRILDPILGRNSLRRGIDVPGRRVSRRLFGVPTIAAPFT